MFFWGKSDHVTTGGRYVRDRPFSECRRVVQEAMSEKPGRDEPVANPKPMVSTDTSPYKNVFGHVETEIRSDSVHCIVAIELAIQLSIMLCSRLINHYGLTVLVIIVIVWVVCMCLEEFNFVCNEALKCKTLMSSACRASTRFRMHILSPQINLCMTFTTQ